MKKFMILFSFLLILSAGALLAQDGTQIDIDFDAVQLILATGIGGIGVNAIVNVLKRLLKAQGIVVVIISIAVSAAAAAAWLVAGPGWDLIQFIIMAALVSLAANGIFLNPKKRT